jgi:hypothetical protein
MVTLSPDDKAKLSRMIYDRTGKRTMFYGRQFSDRTVEALIDAGIDAPENLLFMGDKEIASLKGIGSPKLKEIEAYRAAYKPALRVSVKVIDQPAQRVQQTVTVKLPPEAA